MRMLMITPEFPPFVKGGIGKHAGELAEALSEAGHAVTVVALAWSADQPSGDLHPRLHVRWVPPFAAQPPDFTGRVLQFNILTLAACAGLTSRDYDLIALHHYTQGLAAAQLAQAWQIPLVWHAHAMYSATLEESGGENEELRYFRVFEETIGRQAQRIIAISPYISRLCVDLLGIAPQRIDVIPKSIHLEQYARPARGANPTGAPATIVYVGRLSWEKGLETLFEAVSMLLAQAISVRLIVAGVADDPAYLEQLKAEVRRLGITRHVWLRGFVDGDELIALYQQADVVAIPSRYEAFGRVAIEAMAAGAPVVATAVGGLKDVIRHGVNGLLVEDATGMAAAIQAVLSQPALADQLVRQGLAMVAEQYTWPHVLQQTLDSYQAGIQAHAPAQETRAHGA